MTSKTYIIHENTLRTRICQEVRPALQHPISHAAHILDEGWTYLDTQKCISNHHLHIWSSRISHHSVPILPEASYSRRPAPASKSRRLVQQLNDINHSPNFASDDAQHVQCTRHVRRIHLPNWVAGPLPGIVVSILRAWCTVEVEDHIDRMLPGPLESAQEIRPCARDKRRNRDSCRNGPVSDGYPTGSNAIEK